MTPIIVWLRNDLRLHDNLALYAASQTSRPIIVCYIWSEEDDLPYPLGGASRAWLHDSLIEFSKSIQNRLILRKGSSISVLEELIKETKAKTVYWNRRYEPHLFAKDQEIQQLLTLAGIESVTFQGNVLLEPWELTTKEGKPFKVFTPFCKSFLKSHLAEPVDAPKTFNFYSGKLFSENISGLGLLTRNPPLDIWQPGEEGALKAFDHFLKNGLPNYATIRDFPAIEGTSKLSSHLHFGEISIRAIVERLPEGAKEWYLRELIWREFAIHLLHHFPNTPEEPLRAEFKNFPWRRDPAQLTAWQEGMTGYPIVDAGMRQLLATGWMHNRVRMIVGSFLVKQLLLSWKEGEAWFWEKLFDADLANNTLGWQWVSGCGADAAPYFRIFNPVLQGQKFDPDGTYVKTWVPELRNLSKELVHTPWKANIKNYPAPIIELDFGRLRALEAFQEMKNGNGEHETTAY